MAGQKKRRKMEPLMRRKHTSSFLGPNCCLMAQKACRSSLHEHKERGGDRQRWISGVHEVSTHGMQYRTLKHEDHMRADSLHTYVHGVNDSIYTSSHKCCAVGVSASTPHIHGPIVNARTHVCTHAHTHTHARTHITHNTHMCMHITHTHFHTHVHAHTHTIAYTEDNL